MAEIPRIPVAYDKYKNKTRYHHSLGCVYSIPAFVTVTTEKWNDEKFDPISGTFPTAFQHTLVECLEERTYMPMMSYLFKNLCLMSVLIRDKGTLINLPLVFTSQTRLILSQSQTIHELIDKLRQFHFKLIYLLI